MRLIVYEFRSTIHCQHFWENEGETFVLLASFYEMMKFEPIGRY